MYKGYLIGQRVILNNSEIGVIVKPENNEFDQYRIWVMSPSRGYASAYAYTSIKPLPGGQL